MPEKSATPKPWKRPRPKTATKTKLTPASKQAARKAAARAGRRYPNLIDNLNAAKKQRARGRKE